MPLADEELEVISLCSYLTETAMPWRPADYKANKMVKILKGDPINGYFEILINGEKKVYEQKNAGDFAKFIPRIMAKALLAKVEGKATLVPIPNSHVISVDTKNFKTLDLARQIARHSAGRFVASPALVFKSAQKPSRKGGPRSPYHFKNTYRITEQVKGQIVLIDDVYTSGGHLIGACWKLRDEKRQIVLACAFGAATKEQVEKPIGLSSATLSLTDPLEDFL